MALIRHGELKTGELQWLIKEEINGSWWSKDSVYSVLSVYKGACGRFIRRSGTFETDEYGNATESSFMTHEVIQCAQDKPYVSYVEPPVPESPCVECLVLYAEKLKSFADARRRGARVKRNKIQVVKPKRRRQRKTKHDLLNDFEKEQLRQTKRLAGKIIQDKLLPWD